jgi:hypothetical protein
MELPLKRSIAKYEQSVNNSDTKILICVPIRDETLSAGEPSLPDPANHFPSSTQDGADDNCDDDVEVVRPPRLFCDIKPARPLEGRGCGGELETLMERCEEDVEVILDGLDSLSTNFSKDLGAHFTL